MTTLPIDNSHRHTPSTARRVELDNAQVNTMELLAPALLAGPANVIMQLAVPAVGYGVYESSVETGNLFKHPIKRTRTTLSYLAVAAMGDAELRRRYRTAVNHSHAAVHSSPSSPVRYNAFDPELQLWVAACLYRGWEDMTRLYGDRSLLTEDAYQEGAVMGTTLQMPREMWPATRADFEVYWNKTVAELEIDDVIASYLTELMRLKFAGPIISSLVGPYAQLLTIGYLPPEFRSKLGVVQSTRAKRLFDAHNAVLRSLVRALPRSATRLPFDLLLADMRWRIRTGRPLT